MEMRIVRGDAGSAPAVAGNGTPAVADPPEVAEAPVAGPTAVEARGARFSRKARRTRFHLYSFSTVVLLVCLVALVVANTRQVKLSWVLGSSTASLVWIVLGSALFRWRMRAPRA